MGLSRQQVVEKKIDISAQQLERYETGMHRISVGRLLQIAKILKRPLRYFLQGIEVEEELMPTQHQRLCIEVGRNFMKISNHDHQIAIGTLVRSLAKKEKKDN